MSDRDKAIGENLAAYRAGRSQQWLADAMRARGHKWSQATVWSVEKGERPLRFTEAIDVAQILEVHRVDLLQLSRVESDLQIALRAVDEAGTTALSAIFELLKAHQNLHNLVEAIAHADQGRFVDDVLRQGFLDARESGTFAAAQVLLDEDPLDELVATARLDWERRNRSEQKPLRHVPKPKTRETQSSQERSRG